VGCGGKDFEWDVCFSMSSDSSRKKKVRRQQAATGESYMRARRQLGEAGKGGLPAASQERLLSLLGLGQGGVPNVTTLWARPLPAATSAHLRAPVGLQIAGPPMWLDLRDRLSGGDGPHGLLLGATGTGKTTVLQSFLFGLCAQNSPDNLQVMVISGKEKSAFANFVDYPQVTTVPDGSDYKAVLSALVADRIETLRRVDALSDEDWGTDDEAELLVDAAYAGGEGPDEHFDDSVRTIPRPRTIEDYHYVRELAVDGALPPLPFTVLVLDEVGALAEQDRGLVSALESVMRQGRSLGIHVLIAGQGLDPLTAVRISAYTTYRITMGSDRFRASMADSDGTLAPGTRGSGLYVSSRGAEPIAFQGFMVSPELVRDVGCQVALVPNEN
jgi:S-DNA-T family DNA segregation ATPase FtsK/SpoIIIE